jgi:uncharacterized protein (DUF2267 family)
MHTEFDKYAAKGNEFLSTLAKNMGNSQDPEAAFRVLRSTFHVLRKYVTVEESMQILAQLPMALKSIYVDGWKLYKPHARIKTLEEFATEILKEEGKAAWRDFSSLDEVMQDLRAVIITLSEFVAPSELEQAFGTLPKEIKEVLHMWIPS